MSILNTLMGKVLQTGQGRFRAWMGTLGLGIAALLVLAAVQLQSNFNELLKSKENRDTNTQFLVINRQLNSNNLNETALREEELLALKKITAGCSSRSGAAGLLQSQHQQQ